MGKKHYAELREIKCYCSKCDKVSSLTVAEVGFSSWHGECEMCGGHGEVTMTFSCKHCNKQHDVTLDEY